MPRALLRFSLAALLFAAGGAAVVVSIPAARQAVLENGADLAELAAATLRRSGSPARAAESEGRGGQPGSSNVQPQLPAAPLVALSAERHAKALELMERAGALTVAIAGAIPGASDAPHAQNDDLTTKAAELVKVENELAGVIAAITDGDGAMVARLKGRDVPPAQLSAAERRAMLPAALQRLKSITDARIVGVGSRDMQGELRAEVARLKGIAESLASRAQNAEGKLLQSQTKESALRKEFDTLNTALTMERDRNARAESALASLRAETADRQAAAARALSAETAARARAESLQREVAAANAELARLKSSSGTCEQCLRDRIAFLERELAARPAAARPMPVKPNPPVAVVPGRQTTGSPAQRR